MIIYTHPIANNYLPVKNSGARRLQIIVCVCVCMWCVCVCVCEWICVVRILSHNQLTQDSTDIGHLTEMFPNVPMDVIENSLDGRSLQEAVCLLVDNGQMEIESK